MTQETNTQHTPEPWDWRGPWEVFGGDEVYDAHNRRVLIASHVLMPKTWDAAAAARIVACVNACAGMADPAAEIAALKLRIAELEGGSV